MVPGDSKAIVMKHVQPDGTTDTSHPLGTSHGEGIVARTDKFANNVVRRRSVSNLSLLWVRHRPLSYSPLDSAYYKSSGCD